MEKLSHAHDRIRRGEKISKITTNNDVAQLVEMLEEKTVELEEYKRKSLSPKERNTLLKLVLGMALEYYGHDLAKTKTKTAHDISSDLSTKGIEVDEDTVLKWLRFAKDEIDIKIDQNF